MSHGVVPSAMVPPRSIRQRRRIDDVHGSSTPNAPRGSAKGQKSWLIGNVRGVVVARAGLGRAWSRHRDPGVVASLGYYRTRRRATDSTGHPRTGFHVESVAARGTRHASATIRWHYQPPSEHHHPAPQESSPTPQVREEPSSFHFASLDIDSCNRLCRQGLVVAGRCAGSCVSCRVRSPRRNRSGTRRGFRVLGSKIAVWIGPRQRRSLMATGKLRSRCCWRCRRSLLR